jgi:hypothetical protein
MVEITTNTAQKPSTCSFTFPEVLLQLLYTKHFFVAGFQIAETSTGYRIGIATSIGLFHWTRMKRLATRRSQTINYII